MARILIGVAALSILVHRHSGVSSQIFCCTWHEDERSNGKEQALSRSLLLRADGHMPKETRDDGYTGERL